MSSRSCAISRETITQANKTTDKREMLKSLGTEDTLIALWNGQRSTDAFRVPDKMLEQWKAVLLE